MKVDEQNIAEFLAQDALFQRRETSVITRGEDRDLTTFDELNAVAEEDGFDDILLGQRSAVPRSFNQVSRISACLTKDIITALEDDDLQRLDELCGQLNPEWATLRDLELPADFGWERDGEAGQEIVETLATIYCYPKIWGGQVILKHMPSLQQFEGMNPPMYFAGLTDTVGELGKITFNNLRKRKLSIGEKIERLGKYIREANMLIEFLRQYKGKKNIPPMLLNASRRRGQGFHSKLFRATDIVERTTFRLDCMIDEMANRQEMAALLESYGLTKKEV